MMTLLSVRLTLLWRLLQQLTTLRTRVNDAILWPHGDIGIFYPEHSAHVLDRLVMMLRELVGCFEF